ncbi:MAG: macrocin O-methyltransferase, partial [Chromatiales bacterium]|nr:macrocin O-methyltransferase [Chromatiales bacterium]
MAGDLIKTGVWRGGASIFIRGILKAYAVNDCRV